MGIHPPGDSRCFAHHRPRHDAERHLAMAEYTGTRQ
jgi:hypothetical protein